MRPIRSAGESFHDFPALTTTFASKTRAMLETSITGANIRLSTMALSVRRFRDAGIWIWLDIIPMLIIYVVPIWRGAVWYQMMSINAVTSGMVGYSLFFIVFMIFCIVVGCLPSRR